MSDIISIAEQIGFTPKDIKAITAARAQATEINQTINKVLADPPHAARHEHFSWLHHEVDRLEQVLIDTIAEFGVIGQRVGGRSGVWVDVNGEFEKVAAIGIRVAEKTTMHGFALNCDNSLQPYDTIVACGIADAKTTTLQKLTGLDISAAVAAEIVKVKLGKIGKIDER